MRKGLAITLGVVALVLVVSPGFAVAPIISCVPDIIVSDFEQSQTIDNNLFIFSDAIDLDGHVYDSDTTDSSLLRWSFIQSSGPNIEINGIGSNTSGNVRAPGGFDIRTVSQFASVRNVDWSPTAGTMPYPDPTGSPADSMIELYVSDGTNTGSQTVKITSIDESAAGPGDRLIPLPGLSFSFAANEEGWIWFSDASITQPTHQWSGGALTMTEAAGGTDPAIFGSWETPKNPSLLPPLRLGCIQRARYQVRGSVDGEGSPGIRMRAVTGKVMEYTPGQWTGDFTSQDFNSDLTVNYWTPPAPNYEAGREPGTAGKTYTLLNWPQQIESLMATDTATYFSCDILDMYKGFSDDSGTISVEQVDIDGIDRPDRGTGTAVSGLSGTDFSIAAGWSANAQGLIASGYVLPTWSQSATQISLNVQPGAMYFDAAALGPAVALEPGGYYRVIFTVTSTAQAGTGDFGPTFRCGFVGSTFAFSADKNLKGGGLLSTISTTPEEYEVWMEAPPVASGVTQTEPISVRFQSWLLDSNTGFPFNQNVSGTITCTEVFVEQFPVPPTQ
jgi:hypothetical protein